jgi:hypothetical protein
MLEERGPGQDTHWSTRSMAAATGMSQSAISRIWRGERPSGYAHFWNPTRSASGGAALIVELGPHCIDPSRRGEVGGNSPPVTRRA